MRDGTPCTWASHRGCQLGNHRNRAPNGIADKVHAVEEAPQSTDVALSISGPPDGQDLDIRSKRVPRLTQLDFLTSTEARVSAQMLSEEGKEIEAKLAHDKVVTLYNFPRVTSNITIYPVRQS